MINVSVLLYKYVLKAKDDKCFSIFIKVCSKAKRLYLFQYYLYKYVLSAKDDKCFSIFIQVFICKGKR